MEVETKCPFWPICGGAIIHNYWSREKFPYGDPRRDFIGTVCCDENKYLECEHYQIRINPRKEMKKDEAL